MGVPRHGHRPKGKPPTPTYHSWTGMKTRCLCVTAYAYEIYGGRGITICDNWLRFEGFLEDMGERPDGMTLDRIDNDGNYEPGNCRWATPSQQQRNRRNTMTVTLNGETRCIPEWAEMLGINKCTLHDRLTRYGWSVERALTEPVNRRKPWAAQ